MGLIELVIALVIVGFVAWIVLQIPMPQSIRNVIVGVIVFFLVMWVLQKIGFDLRIH